MSPLPNVRSRSKPPAARNGVPAPRAAARKGARLWSIGPSISALPPASRGSTWRRRPAATRARQDLCAARRPRAACGRPGKARLAQRGSRTHSQAAAGRGARGAHHVDVREPRAAAAELLHEPHVLLDRARHAVARVEERVVRREAQPDALRADRRHDGLHHLEQQPAWGRPRAGGPAAARARALVSAARAGDGRAGRRPPGSGARARGGRVWKRAPCFVGVAAAICVVAMVGGVLPELVQQVSVGAVHLRRKEREETNSCCQAREQPGEAGEQRQGPPGQRGAARRSAARTSTPSKPAAIALRAAAAYAATMPGISATSSDRGVGYLNGPPWRRQGRGGKGGGTDR